MITDGMPDFNLDKYPVTVTVTVTVPCDRDHDHDRDRDTYMCMFLHTLTA